MDELNARFALWGEIPQLVFQKEEMPDHGKCSLSSVVAQTSMEAVMSMVHSAIIGRFQKYLTRFCT